MEVSVEIVRGPARGLVHVEKLVISILYSLKKKKKEKTNSFFFRYLPSYPSPSFRTHSFFPNFPVLVRKFVIAVNVEIVRELENGCVLYSPKTSSLLPSPPSPLSFPKLFFFFEEVCHGDSVQF